MEKKRYFYNSYLIQKIKHLLIDIFWCIEYALFFKKYE